MTDALLQLTKVSKTFGTFKALDGVDLTLRAGEVHALLGVNGAGKSTLVKILSGVHAKTAGSITINSREVALGSPQAATREGIAVVQQHTELVPGLTGYENIFLGKENRSRGLFGRFSRTSLRQRADDLLKRFPIEIDLSGPVRKMSPVQREIVAILRALSGESIKVLLLDEPTSVLTEHEKNDLFAMIRTFRERGIGIVYITHRLQEVFEICDRMTIFRNGRNVATLTVPEARQGDVSIADLMLGKKLGEVYPPKTPRPGEVVLTARNLGFGRSFADVNLTARRGEVLGLFGLVGSGLDELAKVLYGVNEPSEGALAVKTRTVRLKGAADGLRQGIFLVPGDRRTEGLTASRDVTFNITLANLGRVSAGGAFLKGKATRISAELADKVALTPPDLRRRAGAFSGGNQQKIVIAKGLCSEGDAYIFLEPTVGVDIGARATIYRLIRELSASSAVIVMSSDAEEIHGLSDRIFTLYKGRVVLDRSAEDVSVETVFAAGLSGRVPTCAS